MCLKYELLYILCFDSCLFNEYAYANTESSKLTLTLRYSSNHWYEYTTIDTYKTSFCVVQNYNQNVMITPLIKQHFGSIVAENNFIIRVDYYYYYITCGVCQQV